jgi:hypothetical protein
MRRLGRAFEREGEAAEVPSGGHGFMRGLVTLALE